MNERVDAPAGAGEGVAGDGEVDDGPGARPAAIHGADERRPAAELNTHAAIDGAEALPLPHERDESSGSGGGAPSEVMKKAHDDAVSGKTGSDRGETTDPLYRDTLRSKTPGAERD